MVGQLRHWSVPYPLTGSAYFFGRVGSGKTWKMMSLAQSFYEKGVKIIDFSGGKREEGPFWCFPSDEKKMWFDFKQDVGEMETEGPKEYPVRLLRLMWTSKMEKKVPEKLPRISTNFFTIYFKDIKIEDIALRIGAISTNAEYLWHSIVKNLPDNANGADILNLMDTKYKKFKELSIYKLFIKPMCDNHALAGKNSKFNIDIVEEIKDNRTISVLWAHKIPDELRLFFMGYVRRKCLETKLEDKVSNKIQVIGIFREVSEFMKVQDKSKQGEDQTQIFRNQISNSARYARSGFYLFLDVQSPAEVKNLIEGQDDILGINEMPSQRDREVLCDQLRIDRRISQRQISYIATMPVYQMVIVTRGKKAKLLKRVQPPRNKNWKPGDGNFLTTWKKVYNEWKSTIQIKEAIMDEYEERFYQIAKERQAKIEKARQQINMARVKKRKRKKEEDEEEYLDEETEMQESKDINISEATEDDVIKNKIDKLERDKEEINNIIEEAKTVWC